VENYSGWQLYGHLDIKITYICSNLNLNYRTINGNFLKYDVQWKDLYTPEKPIFSSFKFFWQLNVLAYFWFQLLVCVLILFNYFLSFLCVRMCVATIWWWNKEVYILICIMWHDVALFMWFLWPSPAQKCFWNNMLDVTDFCRVSCQQLKLDLLSQHRLADATCCLQKNSELSSLRFPLIKAFIDATWQKSIYILLK